jgi:hypothetical protein
MSTTSNDTESAQHPPEARGVVSTPDGRRWLVEKLEAHRMRPKEMGRVLRERIRSAGEKGFGDLTEETWYVRAKGRRRRARRPAIQGVILVRRVTPKGTQAVTYQYTRAREKRLYEGKERRSVFYPVGPRLLAALGHTHREVVREAMAIGRDIPPEIRRHHPDLFISVPDEYETVGGRDLIDRLVGRGSRMDGAATPERIDRWAASVREDMQKHRAYMAERNRDLDPQEVAWIGKSFEEGQRLLQFYGWLKDQVSPGAPLYVPGLSDSQEIPDEEEETLSSEEAPTEARTARTPAG